MIMKKLLQLSLLMLLLHLQMAAQQQAVITGLDRYFSEAYEKYPNIPKGILEAAAYSASHMGNLSGQGSDDDANCMGMPQRFGLFGLVEDGRGYFKNNLLEICTLSNITPAQFKKEPRAQILAVAKFLGREATAQRLAVTATAESFSGVLEKLSEIPDDGSAVNAYAKLLYTYDIYDHLQKGFVAPSLKLAPSAIQLENIYPAKTLRLLKAPGVRIEYDQDKIIAPDGAYTPSANSNTNARDAAVLAVQSTDYPPALWDEAHTNNWAVGRAGTAITNVTIHTMQGSYSGTISWFNNGNQIVNGVHVTTSAHYLVRSSDGQITQMVRDADRAFHVLSANYYTIGIEHEGFVTDASWYTDNMYNSSAALVRDICGSWTIDKSACFPGPATSTTNFQPITVRIKGHQHYTGNTHTDPGINWNWPKYAALINLPVLPSTRIAFTVKDQSTGAVVASATATVTKPNGTTSTLTTNASGVLVFGADSGSYSFTFSKSGYNSLTTFFVGGGADDSVTADINLDAAGTVVPANEPATIRVVTNCACAACGNPQLQVMSLEAYVQTGLDDEWLSSWNAPSLQAGAVAYRSRGAWYVQHPVGVNYDISSATCHQTWQNDRATSVKNAAIATAGVLLVKNGAIVKADYAAENNNAGCGDGFSGNGTTWTCISDARCAGRTNNGSGKGMCQWGSSFWGTDQTYTWILNHYYGPDSVTIQLPAAALVAGDLSKTSEPNEVAGENLRVAPNPVTGSEVTVEYNLAEAAQAATIILSGPYGNVVQQRPVNLQTGYNRLTLHTGMLKGGMYIISVRLNTSGKITSKKLVVVK